MQHFDITIHTNIMCRHIFCQTNFQHCCWRSVTWILYRPATTWLDTDPVFLNFTRYLSIQVLRSDVCWNMFVFSCSRLTAHCWEVPSVCDVQFRVLQLHCDITSKYSSLLLSFCALNTYITPSNNAVCKGMKQRYDDNWICFNTVTQFCSTLAFTVQFKRLI